MAGFEPTKPNETHFMPSKMIGSIYFAFYFRGCRIAPSLFIRVGKEGPNMSESNIPTLNPCF
jgi:hypothetical protein